MNNDIKKAELELLPLQNEIMTIEEKINSIEITNDAEYAQFNDMASGVKTKRDAIEAQRKFFTAPLNKIIDDYNAMFMPQVKHADDLIKLIKSKMITFFNKKEAERMAEEKRLQAIRDKANAKREEQGKDLIIEPVKEVAEVQRTVSTGFSKSTAKKVWTHEILHLNELPEDIKQAILGEAYNKGIVKTVVQKFVNAGIREMSGVRIYEATNISIGK